MASGTISGGTYNARYSYFMTWTSVSNGSVANTSNVTLNWVYKKTASDSYNAYNTSGSSKVTLVINGSSSGAMRADFDLRSAAVGTEKVIATYTVNNIPHNADGTCTINVSGSHVTGLNWGTKSIGNTAITLDTIPRYATCSQSLNDRTETSLTIGWTSDSTIDLLEYSTNNGSSWTTVSGTPNPYTISGLSVNTTYNIKTRVRRQDSQLKTESSVAQWSTLAYPYINTVETSALTIGGQQTLTLYNPKGRNVTVYMKHNNTSGTQIYSGSTSSTTIQFTPTASTLYNLIPNAKSGNCVYYCVYSGNTSGTKSGTFVVNENNNRPSISSSSAYDNNDITYGLTGNRNKIVLNGSNMALTINANAKNSATFNNNGYIKVNGTALTLTISGSNATGVYNLNKPSISSYTVELKDSRGIITTTTVNLSSYVSYFTPSITGTAVRNQPTDNKVNLNGNGNFFNGSFSNSINNTLNVSYTIKEKSTSTVLETGSITATSSGNDYTLTQKQVSNVDYTKEYVATLMVADSLNSVSTNINIPKGTPVFWWNKNKFTAIENFEAKGDVDVVGDVTIGNKLYLGQNGFQDYSDAGFSHDQYGNWKHKRNNTSDIWSIRDNNGTNKVSVLVETGDVQLKSIVAQDGRTSSPNFDHQHPFDKASMKLDICSSSMNNSGVKPNSDGYLLTFFWDNTGQYDSQLFIPNSTGQLQTRFKNNGTWSNWYNIYNSQTNYDYYSNTNVKLGYMEVWKCGNVVQFIAPNDVPSLAYGETLWLNLPAAYRPNTDMIFKSYNNTEYVYMKIETNGDVYLCNYSQAYTGQYNFGVNGTYLSP